MEEQKEKQKQQQEAKEWSNELFKEMSSKLKDVNLDNKTLSYLVRAFYDDIWKPTKELTSVVNNEDAKKMEYWANKLKDLFVEKLKQYNGDLEKVKNDKELRKAERRWQRYRVLVTM